ncbi:MAG TPA: hypothetical protein PLQ13_04665 [Candidatus Krumholzibacteria bacterium]|nr:hypothetical protein [Candidatus Krumholzibacteria bacterium]
MNRKIVLALLLALVAAAPAAHGQNAFGVCWTPALPLGDTDSFAPGLTGRGIGFDWRAFRSREFALGASFGWSVFHETTSGTFDNGTVAVTANRWNTINAAPIYVSAFRYGQASRREPRWFAGLNAGTVWLERRTLVGLLEFKDTNWHLAVAPEVGVQLPWDAFLGYAALRWNVAFSAGDVDTQQWLELRLGFGLD